MSKILIISHLFNNNIEQQKAPFVSDQVKWLSELVELKVIAPILWYPFSRYSKRWGKLMDIKKRELHGNVEVSHPRYLAIPIRISATIAAFFYSLSVGVNILQIREKFEFDIIHAHFAYPDGITSVVMGKIFHTPVILTVHGSDINEYLKIRELRFIITYILNNVKHVIAVSESLKQKIIEMGIDENKITVIPNGYDPKLFKIIDQNYSRTKLNLPHNKKILLFIGTLTEIKGLNYLIKAMKDVIQYEKNVLLIIVGEGYEKEQYKLLTKNNNLEDYIEFVGSKKHSEIPLWLNACDLFVLPSINEGFGVVLIEAAACGKPVVASNVGGIPEASNPIARKLIPPKDSKELAKSILEMLNSEFDPVKIIAMNEKFKYDLITKNLIGIYETVKE